jgi:tetratricopeptide (TPR) repeat protein
MERKKYILIAVIGLLFCPLFGQNNHTIYHAFAAGNMKKWKAAMDSIEAIKHKSNKELLDLLNYQYGYIAWNLGKKNTKEADKYLIKAYTDLKLLEKKQYNLPVLYAYKAALTGFEIGLHPYKAPFIGPKSIEYAKMSVKLDSSNSMGYIQLGNIAYYMPAMFGGSKTEALIYYLKALSISENKIECKNHNWNYLNLLSIIIQAHMGLEQYHHAETYCIKALAVEPGFDWVKKGLYPQVLKKISHHE